MSESAYIYVLIVTTPIALALVCPYFFLPTNHVSAMVCSQPCATHACYMRIMIHTQAYI